VNYPFKLIRKLTVASHLQHIDSHLSGNSGLTIFFVRIL